ncbi:MAG: hypothetical protein IPK53_09755 [bacterium]|nr:hypothetical protein [bacterium]
MFTHSNSQTIVTQDPDVPETTRLTSDLPLAELQRRAGGLARELGHQYGFNGREWRTHWQDMTQTALLAFLENSDQSLAYAYICARTALKNYAWVHIRGLNGGWKSSLPAITASSTPPTAWMATMKLATTTWPGGCAKCASRTYPAPGGMGGAAPRSTPPPEVADLFRDLLVILVGMSSERWYPEQMYRGALILAMKLTGHLWEEVSTAVGDLGMGLANQHLPGIPPRLPVTFCRDVLDGAGVHPAARRDAGAVV